MATTGITRLDDLLAGVGAPIGLNEPAPSFAVGAVQDLLKCWFPDTLPLTDYWPKVAGRKWAAPLFFAQGSASAHYGVYDQRMHNLVLAVQQKWNRLEGKPFDLPETGEIDRLTLSMLPIGTAHQPYATPGYFIFAHELKLTHTLKALTMIAARECLCDFTTPNRNNDGPGLGAGLSCGLFHWSQKTGRLFELIDYFFEKAPDALSAIFGDKPNTLGPIGPYFRIKRVLDQLELKNVALYTRASAAQHNTDFPNERKRKAGDSIDRSLEFANPDPGQPNWLNCFTEMLSTVRFQKLMLEFGLATIQRMYDDTYEGYPEDYRPIPGEGVKQWAPKLTTERGVIFTLDMVNQHGKDVKTWYRRFVTAHPNAGEGEILHELQDRGGEFWMKLKPLATKPEQVKAKESQRDGDRARRQFYLDTWYLGPDVYDPRL